MGKVIPTLYLTAMTPRGSAESQPLYFPFLHPHVRSGVKGALDECSSVIPNEGLQTVLRLGFLHLFPCPLSVFLMVTEITAHTRSCLRPMPTLMSPWKRCLPLSYHSEAMKVFQMDGTNLGGIVKVTGAKQNTHTQKRSLFVRGRFTRICVTDSTF